MSNFLVYKSSAGSGKTYTLMVEYLSLALKRTNSYSRILAITFTNKAANEIKQRILENLKQIALLDNLNIPVEKKSLIKTLTEKTGLTESEIIYNASQVLTAILHNYSEFAVSTIDSFMHKVIRSFAFDLKLSMNFEVELDTQMLLNSSVDELIAKVGKDEELTDLLTRYVISKAEADETWDITASLRNSASALLKEKMAGLMPALEQNPLSNEHYFKISGLKKFVKEFCKQQGIRAVNLISSAGIDLTSFSQKSKGIGCFFEKIAAGEFPNMSDTVRKTVNDKTWFGKGSSEYNKFSNIEDEITVIAHSIERKYYEKAILDLIDKNFHSTLLLKRINDELSNIRQHRNVISINDFNTLIGNVVKEQPVPFVYLRVGEKYNHFMIDEFQDTSVMQWENLLPLIENSLSDGKKNMIVGDGKQAIYRFKNGDAEQFVTLPALRNSSINELINQRERLLKYNYKQEPLAVNYRSCREIVEFNNQFFEFAAPIFIPEDQHYYKEVKQDFQSHKDGGLVNIRLVPECTSLDAIVETVNKVKSEGYEYGDIAVLTRTNKSGVKIAEAFQIAGIDVVSSESLLLGSSAEVNFLVSWIGLMSNPEDKVYYWSIVEYLFINNIDLLNEKKILRTNDACLPLILEQLEIDLNVSFYEKLSFYDSIEVLIKKFSLMEKGTVYVRFFLDEILNFTLKESSGASGFIQYWFEKCKDLSVSIPKHKDAVQLLTVHKSKGLDFPVVIYAYPDSGRGYGDISWSEIDFTVDVQGQSEKVKMPMVFSYTEALNGTPFENEYKEEKKKVNIDKFNLYYVAFTRAAERLYVVLEKPKKPSKSENTLLGLVEGFIKDEADEFTYGNGTFIKGKYKNNQADDVTAYTLGIDYECGDWQKKITIAQRSLLHYHDILNDEGKLLNAHEFAEIREKIEFGKLMHKVLSGIDDKDDPDAKANRLINSLKVNEVVRQKLIESVKVLMLNAEVNKFFSGGEVISEAEIITCDGKCYRPDRVVVRENETYIIDFKTGKNDPKHVRQLLNYQALIEQMGYKNVSSYIIYISDTCEVVKAELQNDTTPK